MRRFKFLNSSIRQAEKYIDKLVAIETLYNSLIDFAENRKISRDAIQYIFNKPVFMINGMKEELGVSYNTARRYTNELVKAGIIYDDDRKRNKLYRFYDLIDML